MTYQLEMKEQFDCARSAEDAFDYIVDFSRITQWDSTIVSAKKASKGTIGLGSQFDLVYAMGPRKSDIRYEITEFHPHTKAVLTGTSDNFTAVDTVTIRETDQGCHVNWHAVIEFRGSAAKIIPLIEKKVKKAGIQTIKDLATALHDNFEPPKLSALAQVADKLVVPGVLSFSKFGYQSAKKNWNPVTRSVKGKHILVTGATSGLGLATASRLAHLGAELTLVARDKSKAELVAKQISAASGNNNIAIEIAELSSIAEVNDLTDRLLKTGKPIDVLINNAGALLNPREETPEGLEKSFALLLLAPYLLTEKLHPLLAKADNARIINVSSGGMYAKRLSLSNLESTKGEYSGSDAYARAKRGLVIMGEQWAERWAGDGITVHNMHPGWALTPGVEVGLPGFTKATRRILRTPEQGADTIIWLATATEAAKTTGLFWLDRAPHSTHLSNKTKETAEQRIQLRESLDQYLEKLLA